MRNGYVRYVETGNKYGNMNTAKAFYPEDYTAEDRKRAFNEHRLAAASDYGFKPYMTFMASQVNKDGSYKVLDEEYVSQYTDGWDADIDEDILIVTEKTPEIVIGHPVADCPVVMMTDVRNGVSAIGHCSGEMIDKKLPMMIADALVDYCGSNDDEICTFVSACAGPNWTYDSYPKWATDMKMWEKGIYCGEDGLFHIDLRKVIASQLMDRKIITNSVFSKIDTISDPRFYSNAAASPNGLNMPEKAGRNFSGLFYKSKVLEKTKTNGFSK